MQSNIKTSKLPTKKVDSKNVKSTRKKGRGSIKDSEKQEILSRLKMMIISGKKLEKYKYELAMDLDITINTLNNYLKELYVEMDIADVKEMSIDFKLLYDKMLSRYTSLWKEAIAENDYKAELYILDKIQNLEVNHTRFLENWGFKERIVDQIKSYTQEEELHLINERATLLLEEVK